MEGVKHLEVLAAPRESTLSSVDQQTCPTRHLCSLTQSTFMHILMQDSVFGSGLLKAVNCVSHLECHPESWEP